MNPSTLPVSPWTYPFMTRQYPNFPNLWTLENLGALFIVKVPPELAQLSKATYRQLMQTRLDSMIQAAVSETSQSETQQWLASTLSQLDWAQEIPVLETDADRDFALEYWRQQWAETLILSNWRFQERLSHYGASFPATPVTPHYPDYSDWLSLHDETPLAAWLSELTL
ncbi:hypothetical protein PN498_04310 [Oscillatoria sp. CS-180]|uniref:hypothetical protein n=1 Tax=Oscillatoria sp. CS-180 TaxID=3021720 RepID=UPI00232F8809|nr:hypothetical protein [Oscillatoria sp. CS-180]MDB9525199.1 hypothetical protein [Oscillatoria sp. CS-180]